MFDMQGFGTVSNPMQLYFEGLDKMAQGMSPLKGMARAQIEMMGLMSRRAQAYLEIPSRLSRCRSPQDLVNEQMRFWQTAAQQYSESSYRIMESYRQGWTAATTTAVSATPFRDPAARKRDYISFPGTNGASPPRSPNVRRVA
jgi:hypothetical protein